MNKMILSGYLTRDPWVRADSEDGEKKKSLVKFTVAHNTGTGDKQRTNYFNCTAFGGTADFVKKYFKKGKGILIEGRPENNNYTNKNGEKVYSMDIMVDSAEFWSNGSSDKTEEPETVDVDESVPF